MPVATTQITNEVAKIHDLLRAVQSENPPSNEELEQLSDRAIDGIRAQALMDPENRRILRVPPRKGTCCSLIKIADPGSGVFGMAYKVVFKE